MGYKKCPRCELNYIRDDQQLCDVCSRKRKASDDDNEVLMCIECGENPAMKGKELCADGEYVDRKINTTPIDSQEQFFEEAYKNADKSADNQ